MSLPFPALAVTNADGVTVEAGPYVGSSGYCSWCTQQVTLDHPSGLWRSALTGRIICSPDDRYADCLWHFYREHGIDPLTLKGHDYSCKCQAGIMHHAQGRAGYPFPDRIPFHCGQPARLTPDEWRCRECAWTVAPGRRFAEPASSAAGNPPA